MSTHLTGKKYNFKEIFETIEITTIKIPMMQRDYAHGRNLPEVNAIRENLLKDIYETITSEEKEELNLDFIYGDLQENKLIPLDGQQRLTTLFLLYWYAIKKENMNKFNLKDKFTYETRVSAREFCKFLIEDFEPNFNQPEKISEQIKNNKKFPLSYADDPTVASMLVMLDAIDDKFKNVENLYTGLNTKIKFFFLPIEDMGNTEQLYINMNSRGKPLTDFENAKAELKKLMEENKDNEINDEFIANMMNNFDGDWTDAIWELCGNDDKNIELIDKVFIQYIRFICDILCFENKQLPIEKRVPEDETWNDDLTITQLMRKYFSKDIKDAKDNILTLNEYLECLGNLKEFEENNKEKYFYSKDNEDTDNGQIKDFNDFLSIVRKCLMSGKITRIMPIDFLKLYTIISSFKNDKLNEDDIKKRFRIMRNLIEYSNDEAQVRRKEDNHFPLALKQIDYIMEKGKIADNKKEIKLEFADGVESDYQFTDFNTNQKDEEIQKTEFYKDEYYKKLLFRIEDNDLLKGKISIIGMETGRWLRFENLFKFCDKELIDKAMMAVGQSIYGIGTGKHQFGLSSETNSATDSNRVVDSWYKIFSNWDKGDNETKYNNNKKLNTLLDIEELDKITADGKNKEVVEKKLKEMINAYIVKCETNNSYDFRYYYIKYYDQFRPVKCGKYDFESENYYEAWVMETDTKRSRYSYQPFLQRFKNDKNKKDDIGERGLIGLYLDESKEKWIESWDKGLVIISKSNEKRIIKTTYENSGIDKMDRINLLGKIIDNPEEFWEAEEPIHEY